jgi:putative transcriptional regulator
MDKKLFKQLVESMGQMDDIVRGVRAPSRELQVDTAKVKETRAHRAGEGAAASHSDGPQGRLESAGRVKHGD